MKTIKDAVIELGGKLPPTRKDEDLLSESDYPYYFKSNELREVFLATGCCENTTVCGFDEFESTAKRMGYINGYEWGKEYPTNGKRPDLGGIIIKPFFAGAWRKEQQADSLDWRFDTDECDPVTRFVITDPRYKPVSEISESNPDFESVSEKPEYNSDEVFEITDSHWENAPVWAVDIRNKLGKLVYTDGNRHCKDVDSASWGKFYSVDDYPIVSKRPSNENPESNWHERGELPPVGVRFEAYFGKDHDPKWNAGVVAYKSAEHIILRFDDGDENHYEPATLEKIAKFRPIRTEREKVIEAASLIMMKNSGSYGQAAEALYNAGMLVLPQDSSDTKD